jgi:hypothetical protein
MTTEIKPLCIYARLGSRGIAARRDYIALTALTKVEQRSWSHRPHIILFLVFEPVVMLVLHREGLVLAQCGTTMSVQGFPIYQLALYRCSESISLDL